MYIYVYILCVCVWLLLSLCSIAGFSLAEASGGYPIVAVLWALECRLNSCGTWA